jgi:hypothetical protein
LLAALSWVEGALLGSIATAIAVVCVATVGLMMFSGRLDMRRGLVVVLGCFVLFGASKIVSGFPGAASPAPDVDALPADIPTNATLPAEVPASQPDPYAGASVIRR